MIKIARCVVAALIVASAQNVASAVAINLNDFFFFGGDPVTVAADGSSATIGEDTFFSSVLLVNDPYWGDPNVIQPAEDVFLTFEYEYAGSLGNVDTFQAILFDSDVGISASLDSFSISTVDIGTTTSTVTSNGSISFDLTSHLGSTLGLQFELYSSRSGSNPDLLFDSVVTISNVRLETDTSNVPESSTNYLLLLGSLTCLLAIRRFELIQSNSPPSMYKLAKARRILE